MGSILIAVNVIRRLMKEITALSFIFIFPIVAVLLAVLITGSSKVIDVGISYETKNDYGLVKHLENKPGYNVTIMPETEIKKKLESKEIKFGLVLPDTIADTDKIQLISLKDSSELQEFRSYIDWYLGEVLSGNEPPIINVSEDNNDDLVKSKAAIGIVLQFIIMFIGTGMQLLLEDKRLKTFMRTFCAPLREYEMVLGHLLANIFIGVLQIGVFLTAAVYIFKLDFGTSLINIFLLLFLFLIAAIGLGIGLSGFMSDSGKYNMALTTVAVISSFIGGCFFPLEYMSDFFRKLANITPQKWLLDAFIKLNNGLNIFGVRLELLVVILFGIVFFTFGIKTLKPSPEDM